MGVTRKFKVGDTVKPCPSVVAKFAKQYQYLGDVPGTIVYIGNENYYEVKVDPKYDILGYGKYFYKRVIHCKKKFKINYNYET